MTDVARHFDDAARERERIASRRKPAPPSARRSRATAQAQGEELAARLDRTWRRPPGFIGWLATVDHKEIGRRYIVTAFVFLALGGVLGAGDAAAAGAPGSALIGADRYNQIFTMHGTTMMFLFAVPVMEGDGGLPRPADARHAQRRRSRG